MSLAISTANQKKNHFLTICIMVEKSTTDLIDWYTINQLNGCIPWLIIYPLFSTDKIPRFVIVTFLHGRMHSWAVCRNAGIGGQGDARPPPHQILADPKTLSQPQGRQIIPTPLLLPPPRFSDLPTSLQCSWGWVPFAPSCM